VENLGFFFWAGEEGEQLMKEKMSKRLLQCLQELEVSGELESWVDENGNEGFTLVDPVTGNRNKFRFEEEGIKRIS
jgi:hypothetical protein